MQQAARGVLAQHPVLPRLLLHLPDLHVRLNKLQHFLRRVAVRQQQQADLPLDSFLHLVAVRRRNIGDSRLIALGAEASADLQSLIRVLLLKRFREDHDYGGLEGLVRLGDAVLVENISHQLPLRHRLLRLEKESRDRQVLSHPLNSLLQQFV